MNFIVNLLISAIAVMLSAWLLPGIHINGFVAALLVAVVLAILNRFVKPVLVLLTLPISIFTLGLFYLVINVLIVYMAEWVVKPDFSVDGFFYALLFSVVLSIVNSLLDAMAGD